MKKITTTILLLINICSYTLAQRAPADPLKSAKIALVDSTAPRYVNDVNSLSTSQLFNEVDPSGYDLLSANLSFSDKDQVQKVGFSPLRLLNEYYGVLSNIRVNITNKGGALTSGLSIGYDNSAYESNRVKRLFENFGESLPDLRARGTGESISAYAEYYKSYKKQLDVLAEEFDLKRVRSVTKIAAGYNAQFFSVLKSRSDNTSFDSLNYHGFKGHNLFVNASYSICNGSLSVSGSFNYFNKRKSADSIQQKSRYNGWSFGISKRVVRLMKDAALKKKDFYLNTRFVPSLYIGLSYEQSDFLGDNYKFAEDNTKRVRVFTPFIDIALNPTVQFRLCIPIKNTDEYLSNGKGEQIGAVVQFNYKLINLAN